MTIFQPRISNISNWEITKSVLLDWAESTLKPRAKLAWNGEGDFHSGKHCRFCKIKANCRKRAEEMPKYDFIEPSTLNISEIEDILDRADEVISYLHDVKSFALAEILDGKQYDRYTVKEGRSIRKYTDKEQVAEIVANAGYDPYVRNVLSITEMTKMRLSPTLDFAEGEEVQFMDKKTASERKNPTNF